MSNSKQDEYGQRSLLTLDGITGTTANVLSDGGAIRTTVYNSSGTEVETDLVSLSEQYYKDKRYSYDGSGNIEYIGKNTDTDASVSGTDWEINKITYSGSYVVRDQWAVGSWNGRAELF